MSLQLDPEFMKSVVWSRPDSPTPSVCSKCFGALPEIPLMLFRQDGGAIWLCNECAAKAISTSARPRSA